MRAHRRHAVALLAIGAVSVTPAPALADSTDAGASPALTCTVHALPPLDAMAAAVHSTSTTGRWLTGSEQIGSELEMLIWHRRQSHYVQVPLDYPSSAGINRHGIAVGTGYANYPNDPYRVAFADVDGTYTPFAIPAGAQHASAVGISNTGVVAGNATTPDAHDFPVTWSIAQPGVAIPLEVPGDESARAVDISGRGRVAVVAGEGDATTSYVVRANGQVSQLQPLVAGAFVEITALSDRWALAVEHDPGVEPYLVRYERSTGLAEAVALTGVYEMDINADGWIAGSDSTGAFLFTDQRTSLPSIDGSEYVGAAAIDDRGRPSGWAKADVHLLAARWTCS